ncbi:hypothetical protein [Segatella bryantii]|uniref:hypothetical protein n=1 Tax=Segatella bryantii TaxID=77095 RepID=UPI00242CF09D|nr:hypothetical protein [Segatella bryantii]
MDENGTKVFEASYDEWGKQTVTLNAIGLHCGYTGHEMLMEFDIINMNGRLYDPILGRFFRERWFGMEIKIKGHLDFYYPSKNVSRSFLFKKSLLPF